MPYDIAKPEDPYEGARKEVVLLELIKRYNSDGALEAQRWVATLNRECQNHISTFADDLTYLILDEKENDK